MDKFSYLVQNTIARLKTEVKTIQHSVDSHSVDVPLSKSRLDVVDKNFVDVITKVDHVSIKDSNVHQIGKKSSLNENQQSTPILVSGNASGEQTPSPGQRVVDMVVSRGVTQRKTGAINTLRPRQMDAISQTTFSNGFCSMKMFEFRLKFH